ncbi:hypothetical protein A343_0472 [Porphyromonas gingivalis JCVI SC001]|nr:hypothetical protein A343_0472 [Porphyromonas gingivalis JCVI SC001]
MQDKHNCNFPFFQGIKRTFIPLFQYLNGPFVPLFQDFA